MNKRILLVLSLQWACSKVPSIESAPTFKQSPGKISKDTEEASVPSTESGTSAFPVFERVDEDTITTKELPGRLVHEGKVLDSKEPLALENGAIVSSDKQTFVVKNGSPIKLPSLDMKKVAKTIEIQIEVANDLSFALVAGTGEGAESCLTLKAKTVLFVDRSEDLAESCWVSLNDWPASLPSVHTSKGLRFSLPVAAFEDLDASFLRVVAKETPKVADADTTPVPEENKVEPTRIQVIQVAQEQVETLPVLIPDLYEETTPVPAPAEVTVTEVPVSSDDPSAEPTETSVVDNQSPVSESEPSVSEEVPSEEVPLVATDDTVPSIPVPAPVEEVVAEDELDEPVQPEASPEAVAFVQEIFDAKKSRYLELKARFDALHKERNEERDQRKKLRDDLRAQKKKMRETCKSEKKAEACENEKFKVSELEKDDESRTQRIAELKSQINDVKKEAEDEALSLKEVKAKLSSMKGSKQSRAARLAAKQRRLEKKAVLAQMREEKEKEKEVKKQVNEAKKAAKEAEKAARETAKQEKKAANAKAKIEKVEAEAKAKEAEAAAAAAAKAKEEEEAKKEAEAAAKAKEEAAKKEAEAAAKAKEEAAKKEAEAKANSTKKQDVNFFEKLAEMISKLI